MSRLFARLHPKSTSQCSPAADNAAQSSSKAASLPIDKAPQSTAKPSKAPAAAQKDDAVQVGITVTKEGDFADWYTQVVMKGELCDYYR